MAWQIDQETGDIVIRFPAGEGIAADPYSGLNALHYVNLSVPNEISVGYPITTSATSGGTLGVPIARSTCWFATYASTASSGTAPSRFAMLDTTGQVWESTSITGTWTFLSSSNSTTGSSVSDGLVYWLGFLFKFRNNKIDYWDGSTWHTDWQTITAGVKHFAYVASDNGLYFTNGNFIGAILLTNPSDPSTFAPGTAASYTYNAQKLQLPVTDMAVSLGEVGGGSTGQSTLLIGGVQNAIYPWNKTAVSFSYPIFFPENYIANIVSANQNAFVFVGKNAMSTAGTGATGRIYITNGATADEYFKVPDYIFNQQDPYFLWGDAIFHRNNLLFGFFVIPNSTSSPLLSSDVWAIDFRTKQFRSISNIPANATGQGCPTALIAPTNLSTPGYGYIIGWSDDGSAPGIGYAGTTAGTVASAVINTDLMPVGTFLNKRTFSQVEIKFRTALAAGETVTVGGVYDGGNSASLLTFAPALSAGTIASVAPVNFMANQWLQFQIILNGNASASSGCRLYELRLR